MKKFLLSFLGAAAFFCSEAQLYLNELYVRPNPNKGNHEYFEVYNAGVTPENADCYTLVTYFNDGKDRGFYVVDFPAGMVSARGFLVGSSVTPTFKYQNGTATSNFSWNDGNINRYEYKNGALVLDNSGAPFDNIFFNKKNGIGESELYSAFLFKSGQLVDAFLGHSHSIVVPSYITEMGMLTNGAGCSALAYNFNNINNEPDSKFGYVIPAAGTDNGYYRCGDGPCPENVGAWQKASNPFEHTPGTPNPTKFCKGEKSNQQDEFDQDGVDNGPITESNTPGPGTFEANCVASSNCFDFGLKTIQFDGSNVTLTFVVRTNCNYDLSNVAFQLPSGAKASSFSSSLGNNGVENGTNNPFYAIKFNTGNGGKNGSEATFTYTVTAAQFATMSSIKVQAKAGQQIGSVTFSPAGCGVTPPPGEDVGEDNGEGEEENPSEYEIEAACMGNNFVYSISGGTYPVTVTLYYDANQNGVIDATDPIRGSETRTGPGTGSFAKLPTDESFILAIDAAGVCDDQIEIYVECPADVILPVTFKTFNANRKDNSVALSWETATEINNKGFNIERRIGNGGWEVVGFVASKALQGNSTSELAYSFNDVNPTRSITAYRLRQVDLDGRIKYSDAKTVRGNGQNAKTLVYPNPTANGAVTIAFEEANVSRNVYVSDMNGRIIQQWRNITNNNIHVENLQPGMYMVRITDIQTGAQVTEKILVNKR